MRIVCPGCAAAYEVPDRLLAADRPVRCVRCGHGWVPELIAAMSPPAGSASLPSVPAPELSPFVQASETFAPMEPPRPAGLAAAGRPAPRRNVPLRLAWAASVLLLVGMGAAGWVYRAELGEAWPPARRMLSLVSAASG